MCIRDSCTSNLAVVNLSKALTHIGWEDESAKKSITEGIVMSLERIGQSDIRRHFHFMREFLGAKDSLQGDCADKLLRSVLESAEEKPKEKVICLIRLLVWLAHELPLVAEWSRENGDCITLLQKELDNMAIPIHNSFESNKKIKALIKCLENIKEGKEFSLEEHIEGIKTMYYEKYLVDSEVLYYDMKSKRWKQCVVNLVLDEMIYLTDESSSGKNVGWVEVESDCLAAIINQDVRMEETDLASKNT
eukprot:TRINITY_DN5885_c0_g2_i2.p1 TRINITY_DN5885_c0_g2~~TRINITY_DN5885_c0_g2_i2.p1  ORF type:complete len:248 (-),score=49.01 TRINITY_DN5885_c0_g2_i2:96-839(-)